MSDIEILSDNKDNSKDSSEDQESTAKKASSSKCILIDTRRGIAYGTEEDEGQDVIVEEVKVDGDLARLKMREEDHKIVEDDFKTEDSLKRSEDYSEVIMDKKRIDDKDVTVEEQILTVDENKSEDCSEVIMEQDTRSDEEAEILTVEEVVEPSKILIEDDVAVIKDVALLEENNTEVLKDETDVKLVATHQAENLPANANSLDDTESLEREIVGLKIMEKSSDKSVNEEISSKSPIKCIAVSKTLIEEIEVMEVPNELGKGNDQEDSATLEVVENQPPRETTFLNESYNAPVYEVASDTDYGSDVTVDEMDKSIDITVESTKVDNSPVETIVGESKSDSSDIEILDKLNDVNSLVNTSVGELLMSDPSDIEMLDHSKDDNPVAVDAPKHLEAKTLNINDLPSIVDGDVEMIYVEEKNNSVDSPAAVVDTSYLDTTVDADTAYLDTTVDTSIDMSVGGEEADVSKDDLTVDTVTLEESLNSSRTTRSGQLNRSLLDASFSTNSQEKCPHCRQRLSEVKMFKPLPGIKYVGENELVDSPIVNIVMEEGEDQRALQYKLTNFSLYDKPGGFDSQEGHLVPIFAESLLSTNKKIYLSGTVLRLDMDEGEDGLNVVDIGPIFQWTNMTGMETDVENVIISTNFKGREIEYNLVRPSAEYLSLFETTYRMVFMANRIILELCDYNEKGMFMEYSELLEFIDSLPPPVMFGRQLQRCDEEFLQLHSDFIVSQISSFEDAGDVEEDLTIIGMPCIKHISDMAGVERRRGGREGRQAGRREGMLGQTPQPETLVKAVTTPLVRTLFESTFSRQMKISDGNTGAVCTCKGCQANNCGRCSSCREMVSFGGRQNDRKLTCVERVCSKTGQVPVYDVEEEMVEDTMDGVAKVSWPGQGVNKSNKVIYDEVILEMKGGDKHTVKSGDFMVVKPDSVEHRAVPHFPCRVIYVYKSSHQVSGRGGVKDCAHVQWMARGENTLLGRTSDPREFFMVWECEDIPLLDVTKILDIKHLPVENIDEWKAKGGTAEASDIEGGKDGFWRQRYEPEFGRFDYPAEEELIIPGDDQCLVCLHHEGKRKAEAVEISDDYQSVRVGEMWYKVGDFIMIEDGTIRYRIPSKEKTVYPKEKKVDVKKYPEYWRKPEEYKGDHFETWDPLQVVRLEEITKPGPKTQSFCRVRKLYRPLDTHLSHEVARTYPYTVLYWTNEIARLYLPDDAVQMNKPSLDTVADRAWVKCRISGDIDELVDWTDEDENRFYIMESYDSATKSFSPVPAGVEEVLTAQLTNKPAPSLPPVTPLNCLDIFAGCGGLSKGLHNSGVTNHKWAIEFWSPAAEAFKKNNPSCRVFNKECNGLLDKAMKGCSESGMPKKGEVDILCGGPPCQGFSLLNNFREKEYSMFKNSLIPTYLSFCDFYRPRYYILENVRNLVANDGGMVLKLIISTLVRMGYQVTFSILQAGHYGVAQTRRRLIVIAAAPGEVLPVYPEPFYCFAGPHFLDIDLDGRKFSSTNRRPGAPRRALTTWDTISDLPEVQSGHDKSLIKYKEKPISHLQRIFRRNNSPSTLLEDHIVKKSNAVGLARIRYIPKTPGADWRDLPNICVDMDDGRMTRKLHYPYRKEDGRRGVCSCSQSTKVRKHFCDADDKQSENLIAWSLPHTADRHNNWVGVYGRVPWDGVFKTTITDPEPLGKQGQVLHPEQDRVLSVREYARSQGFDDDFKFAGTIRDRHREIGNAVPPPLGFALGREFRKAMLKKEGRMPEK